ncbi:MAG TPA: G8 domain-containing protein, partial [Bacteroidia bacterium]|nr:G8 domain-containing protein [Bacteroidia bacterium]
MPLTKRIKKKQCDFIKEFALLLLVLLLFQSAQSATYTSVANGNWDADATWSGTGIPGAGDAVVIEAGKTVTVNVANAACNTLTIGNGGLFAGNGTLIFNASSQLTVSGAMSIGALFNSGSVDMTNGGTFICGSWSLGFSGAGSFTYGTGTVKFTGTFTLPNDGNFNQFYNLEIVSGTTSLGTPITVYGNLAMSNTGILDANGNDIILNGNWTQSGTASFTEGTRTVTFNGTTDQYINHTGTETFAYLVVDKSSGQLLLNSGSLSITNLMTINNGTVNLGTQTLSGTGGLTMNGGDLQIGQLSSVCSCT